MNSAFHVVYEYMHVDAHSYVLITQIWKGGECNSNFWACNPILIMIVLIWVAWKRFFVLATRSY